MSHSQAVRRTLSAVLLLVIGAAGAPLPGQSLERRITSAPGNAVQFHFAARPGVCGDGRTFVRLGVDEWFGTMNDATRSLACEHGPVRVLVTKSGTELIRVDAAVGPLTLAPDAADLGRVDAGEAVAWLGTLASRGDGRVARDALLPLGVADSARVTPTLLALARDMEQPRDTRRSALTWLVRRQVASDAVPAAELAALLSQFARSDGEHTSFRQSALGQLARLDRGEGIPALIAMGKGGDDAWLARRAVEALARSGDPRAMRAVREVARDDGATAEVRAAALAGMAGSYGSAEDVDALITMYPSLTSDRLKEAALTGIATIGNSASRRFLTRVVRDESHDTRPRRRAASLLERAGVPVREVIAAYNEVSDGEVRVQLIELLARAGTREATTKLVAIAKSDTQPAARRRAIAALARSEDASVREALRGIVGQ